MAIHAGVLAWRIPGMAESDGLPSWGRRELDTTESTQQQQQQQHTIIILNSFSHRLPISSFLFGLVSIYLFLYLLNISLPFHFVQIAVFGVVFLYARSLCFLFILYCGGCSLWVGLNQWLVKVSWLGKLASVFWWVELELFSLECNEVSSSFEVSMGLV